MGGDRRAWVDLGGPGRGLFPHSPLSSFFRPLALLCVLSSVSCVTADAALSPLSASALPLPLASRSRRLAGRLSSAVWQTPRPATRIGFSLHFNGLTQLWARTAPATAPWAHAKSPQPLHATHIFRHMNQRTRSKAHTHTQLHQTPHVCCGHAHPCRPPPQSGPHARTQTSSCTPPTHC